jgi:hypothetical protein
MGGDNKMKVPNTNENMAKCICGSCPTFTQNGLSGGFFCARGKSEKVPEMKGCICADCPNWAEYDLSRGYFCIHGASE